MQSSGPNEAGVSRPLVLSLREIEKRSSPALVRRCGQAFMERRWLRPASKVIHLEQTALFVRGLLQLRE
jgi:hypothetical protein